MDGLFLLAILAVPIVILDWFALRNGVDSRAGSPDPRAQVRPVGIQLGR